VTQTRPVSRSTSTSQICVLKPPSAPAVLVEAPAPDRPAGLGRPGGELGQRQRIELAGIVAGRLGLAVVPGDGVGIDLPDLGRALAAVG